MIGWVVGKLIIKVGSNIGWVVGVQVDLTHLFCELEQVWQTQVVDDIPRPHQHRAAILLQQLEVVSVAAVPVELMEEGQVTLISTHTTRTSSLGITVVVSTQSLDFQSIKIVGPVGGLLFF